MWWSLFLLLTCFPHGYTGVRKRVIPVTDPDGTRTIPEWVALGDATLEKSCAYANLDISGTAEDMALRLYTHYQNFLQPLPVRRAALTSLESSASPAWPTVFLTSAPTTGFSDINPPHPGSPPVSSTVSLSPGTDNDFDDEAFDSYWENSKV